MLVFRLHFKHQLPRDSTLPAFKNFHVVTGCDRVNQFAGHGKVTACKMFNQNNQLLTSLGWVSLQTEETHSAVLRCLSAKYMNH